MFSTSRAGISLLLIALSLLVVALGFLSSKPASGLADGGSHKEQIHLMLYDIYKKQRRFDLASVEMQQLIILRPNDPKLRGQLGTDLFTAQKFAAALAELNNAVKSDPTNPDYWGMIGRCNMQLRRYEAAFEAFRTAVRNTRSGGTDYRRELQQDQQYLENERQQKEFQKQQIQRKKDDDDD
jgi:tetratricopeptide (TPR) repeat protein